MKLDDAFNALHADCMDLTNSVKAAWLLSKREHSEERVKYLAAKVRRLSDHLDMLKGLTDK